MSDSPSPVVTRLKLPAVRRAIQSSVWAILPDKLDALLEVVEVHAARGGFTREEIEARVGDRQKPVGRVSGAIQILPLYGIIAPRMDAMSEMSGGTSCEAFGKAFDAAMSNPEIGAVIIDCDSPGGNVMGVPELAAKIAAARGSKPIVCAVSGTCASAAYWLASACDEIVATQSAFVGSIGCYMVHEDTSAMQEKLGVAYQVVGAGKYKTEGAAGQPYDEEALAFIQSQVDEMYDTFTGAVAENRGVKASVVKAGYGEGRVLLAKQAKASGMIDRIATLDETIARLSGRKASPGGARALAATVETTTNSLPRIAASATGGALPRLTDVQLRRMLGAIYSELPSEATDEDPPEPTPGDVAPAPDDSPTPAPDPSPRPDVASQEHIMPDPTPAASLTAVDILAEERKRVGQIQALGRQENASDALVAAAINSGQTEAEFALALSKVRATAFSAKPTITVGADRALDKPFANIGEQLIAIAAESMDEQTRARCAQIGVRRDPRMAAIQAAVSGAGATVGSDGGFAVQTDFAQDLEKLAFETGVLASQCSTTEISANSDALEVTYIDETSRATGSRFGGVQIYRGAEADVATAKKPKFGLWELRLSDLIGLYYGTDRLMQDASALSSVVTDAFGQEFGFTLDDEIVNGTGGPQCQGIVAAPCAVSVAKEAGQVAATIMAENIQKMWIRMPPRWRANASWYINQEAEVQLQKMQIGLGVSGALVYMPPGGLSGVPYGTIFGRPVVPIEQCAALGTVGDIILFAPQQYKLIRKGGLQSDVSIHVKFTSNEWTFRWIMRVNGAPKLKSAITPYKGSATLSSIVTLATRA